MTTATTLDKTYTSKTDGLITTYYYKGKILLTTVNLGFFTTCRFTPPRNHYSVCLCPYLVGKIYGWKHGTKVLGESGIKSEIQSLINLLNDPEDFILEW